MSALIGVHVGFSFLDMLEMTLDEMEMFHEIAEKMNNPK